MCWDHNIDFTDTLCKSEFCHVACVQIVESMEALLTGQADQAAATRWPRTHISWQCNHIFGRRHHSQRHDTIAKR